MKQKYDGIQLLRALAAGMVFVFHVTVWAWYPEKLPAYWASLNFGNVGVLLFFVISGFVIALQRDTRPTEFMLHRLIRIYPPYIVASISGFALAYWCGYTTPDKIGFDISLLLLPGGNLKGMTQVPYWTLVYEIWFYLISFALMCVGGRKGFEWGLVGWAVFVIVLQPEFPYPADGRLGLEVVYSPYNLFFISGAALAVAFAGNRIPLLLIGCASCVFVYFDLFFNAMWLLNLLILMLCVLSLAVVANEYVGRFRVLRPAVTFGDWSYGFYLMHLSPIVAVAMFSGQSIGTGSKMALMMLFGGVAGVLFGLIEFTFYRRAFRGKLNNRSLSSSLSEATSGQRV